MKTYKDSMYNGTQYLSEEEVRQILTDAYGETVAEECIEGMEDGSGIGCVGGHFFTLVELVEE